MKIDNRLIAFINGQDFSSGEKFVNDEKYSETPRTEILKNICAGKDIIHLGCLDHVELIELKIKKNIWLHQLLIDSAKSCIGIDNNEAGVLHVQNQLKIKDIFFADIIKEPMKEIKSRNWDYIILGEILEHTDNPVLFLKKIKEFYKDYIDKIIITVPNILNYDAFRYLKGNCEFNNTDHRYWFTGYTLLKVINQANLTPLNIRYCNRIPLTNFQLAKRKFRKVILGKASVYPFPFFSTLMIECKL